MRKIMPVLLCILCLILLPAGCRNDDNEKESEPMSQEEFQEKYRDVLYRIGVLTDKNSRAPIEHLDDEYYIWETDLKGELHLHAWIGDGKGNLPNDDEIITYDEVLGLYFQYDEAVFGRFEKFHRWYTRGGGERLYNVYRDGIQTAYFLFIQDYGIHINDREFFTRLTFDDYLELEEYMREHPHFEEEDRDYRRVLEWLDVREPEPPEMPHDEE